MSLMEAEHYLFKSNSFVFYKSEPNHNWNTIRGPSVGTISRLDSRKHMQVRANVHGPPINQLFTSIVCLLHKPQMLRNNLLSLNLHTGESRLTEFLQEWHFQQNGNELILNVWFRIISDDFFQTSSSYKGFLFLSLLCHQ